MNILNYTGMCFLFDVTFYGNTQFEPLVLEAAFGSNSSNVNGYKFHESTFQNLLLILLISLPAYFVTVLLIG